MRISKTATIYKIPGYGVCKYLRMEGNGEKHGTPIFIFSFMHYLSIKIWMKDIQYIVMEKINADKNMASRKENQSQCVMQVDGKIILMGN